MTAADLDLLDATLEARDHVAELAAHVLRLQRAIEAGRLDADTRYDIGEDLRELTDVLGALAVRVQL